MEGNRIEETLDFKSEPFKPANMDREATKKNATTTPGPEES